MTLLEVENLQTQFLTEEGVVRAVDRVSFLLEKEKVLGIVGESGSGKSVMSLSIMRLVAEPGRIVGGEVLFKGVRLFDVSEKEMRSIRGNKISMIFQDPMTSLNPVFKVGSQLIEAVLTHNNVTIREAKERAITALEEVGIPDPRQALSRYPHEFSGGMRQRVMIAMALINNPEILIADEPTTALDVTVQAQILNLMRKLRSEHKSAVILITHDLGVVAEMCDEVIVMYAGRIFEKGTVEDIFYRTRNPYTYGLLKSIPRIDEEEKELVPIKGTPPSLIKLPSGCLFNPRCEFVKGICFKKEPKLNFIGNGHYSYCHFAQELNFAGKK